MSNVVEDSLIFKEDFTPLAKKFNVYSIDLWSSHRFFYNSSEIQRNCEKSVGIALSPACTEVHMIHSVKISEIYSHLL